MKIFLLVVAMLASYGACGAERKASRSIEDVFPKAEAIQAIKTASTIRIWRLERREKPEANGKPDNKSRAERSEDERSLNWARQLRSDYENVGKGVEVAAAQIPVLRKTLLDPASYTGPRFSEDGDQLFKGCGFWPNVRIEFSGSDGKIEIWLCFSCSDLLALDESRVVGGDEFKPVSHDLLALVKSVLRDDPVIAKLRAR